jgi:twinkle protein
MTAEILPMRPPGYYSLADLPQRGSIAEQAFGTGLWEVDRIIKFYLGQFVVVTGLPGHGKSTFMLNVLTRLAHARSTRSFLYVPENEGYLMEKMRPMWPGDDESFAYFAENQCFIQSAIPHTSDEPPHTLDWVLGRAERAVRQDKAEIVMIDPWNELDRAKPRDMLMTDYICQCLMLIKQFCRCLDAIVIVVAHPTKAANERPVGLGDIEGSMNWFNKCDNGLIVRRDVGKNTSVVVSAKVREIGAGMVGACHFMVDPLTGVFTPQYGSDFDGQQ